MTCNAPGCDCGPTSPCGLCVSTPTKLTIDDDVLSNSLVYAEQLYNYDSTLPVFPCNPINTTLTGTCLGIDPFGRHDPRDTGACHRLWRPYLELWWVPGSPCTWVGRTYANCESCYPYVDTVYGTATIDGDSDATWVYLTLVTQFYDRCAEYEGGSTSTHLEGTTIYRILKTDFSCTCGNCFSFVSNEITFGPTTDGGGNPYCPPCNNWPEKITVGPAFTGNESRAVCFTYGYGYNFGSGCPQCCDYCFDVVMPDIAFNGTCTHPGLGVGATAPAFEIAGATYNLGYRSRGRICRWSSEPLSDTGYSGDTYTNGIRVDLYYNIHNPRSVTLILNIKDPVEGTLGSGAYSCETFDCATDNVFERSLPASWCGIQMPLDNDYSGMPLTLTVTTGADCVGGASAGCVKDCYYRSIGTVIPGEYEWELQESSTCECKCYPPSRDPVAGDINVAGTCKSDHSAACSASTATWVWCVFDGANSSPPLPAGLSCGAGTGQTVSQWFQYSFCPTGCSTGAPAFDGTVHGEQTTTICF